MTYAIDRQIPVPDPAYVPVRKYPFPAMQVDDSFFVPACKSQLFLTRQRVSVAGRTWRRRHRNGHRFKVLIVNGGVRCWRIA